MEIFQLKIQAIRQAVIDDDFLMLKQLIDSEEVAISRDKYGRTPLHLVSLDFGIR